MALKQLNLRIDEMRLEKIKHIAAYEERSLTKHILVLIRKNIQEFERKFGVIQLEAENGLL